MLGTLLPEGDLAPYHEDMLIVRLRASARRMVGRKAAARTGSSRQPPGLATLRRYEQEGRLHRIVPMTRATSRPAGRKREGMLDAAVHLATKDLRAEAEHTGSMLVHLRDAHHRPHLHRALSRDPHVASVSRVAARYLWAQEDGRASVKKELAASLPPERMWNHARIRLAEAQALKGFRDASAVRVAIIDTGVDPRHPALRGRIHEYVHRYEHGPIIVSGRDIVGHGTHVAGVIAAVGDATLGVSGICACRLVVFKVFRDDAGWEPTTGCRCYSVDPVMYRLALSECLHRRIQVLNLSLGGPAADPHEAALLSALRDRGTVVVAAMGNAMQHRDQKAYPAAEKGVIAVGAVNPDDTVAAFSRRGRHISLAAPGVAIWSTLPTYDGQLCFLGSKRVARNTHYDGWLGTSAAAPHVAAAVALLIARLGRVTPPEARRRLMRSADRVPGMRGKPFDRSYGAGRLNLRRLLRGAP